MYKYALRPPVENELFSTIYFQSTNPYNRIEVLTMYQVAENQLKASGEKLTTLKIAEKMEDLNSIELIDTFPEHLAHVVIFPDDHRSLRDGESQTRVKVVMPDSPQ